MESYTVKVKMPKGEKIPCGVFEEINEMMRCGLSAARIGIRLGGALYIIEYESDRIERVV